MENRTIHMRPGMTRQELDRIAALRNRAPKIPAEELMWDKTEKDTEEKTTPQITVIAPIPYEKPKLRVAAYCRVSTGLPGQETSITGQRQHYEAYIRSNPEWEFAGIYWEADVSGTNKEKRPELQRLIADCEAGKVQKVLTKSISRFSRNTTDCIEMVRRLKAVGVNILFEKENIDTGKTDSELFLTLYSTFAESESRSISTNSGWSIKKRFETDTYKQSIAPYGYDKDFNIDPVKAEIVKEIFNAVLSGSGTPTIARELNRRGVETGTKKNDGSPGRWNAGMIAGMIKNVAYMGDVLRQKTYHEDFKTKINHGERKQYYSEDHHEGIVDRETFELANEALRQRGKEKGNDPTGENQTSRLNRYIFSGHLRCGDCGGKLIRLTQYTKDGKRYHWGCLEHLNHTNNCGLKRVTEEDIKTAFVNMLNRLCFAKDLILEAYEQEIDWKGGQKNRKRITEIETKLKEINEEKERLSLLISKGCGEPVFYRQKLTELDMQENTLKDELDVLREEPPEMEMVRQLRKELGIWERGNQTEFPEELFTALIEQGTVKPEGTIVFRFKCGLELEETYTASL